MHQNQSAVRPSLNTAALARAAAATVMTLGVAGCSMFQAGVPARGRAASAADRSTAQPESDVEAIDPAKPVAATPADLMFQSDDAPFAKPASLVNVFGEVDGVGPSPFAASGRGGFAQHTFVDEGYDADPTVSPDGQWLLFSSTRHSEHGDLYLQRVDGLAVTQLTADPADDAFPRFSPDGKWVTFASNRAGNWDVYVMDADGNGARAVTRSGANEIHPSFSPDGTRIVYSALGGRSGQWELWTVDVGTGERRMIGYGLFPDWSPRADRDVIAFQRARQRGTRWFSAWTLELVEGEARDVTEVAYSPDAAVVAPTWSPDGRRLAFCAITDPQAKPAAKGRAIAHGERGDVWTIDADGSDRVRVTDGRGLNATPTWASDGRLYFVSDRGGTESIWSAAAGGATANASARRVGRAAPQAIEPTEPHAHAPVAIETSTPHETPAAPRPAALMTTHDVPPTTIVPIVEARHDAPPAVPHETTHETPHDQPPGAVTHGH